MPKVNIGLGQARRLAQMTHEQRLDFIAEGLPIVLASAAGFFNASKALKEYPREIDVLLSYAEEEAAKALILIDIVRCPRKLISSKIGTMTGWFYNHLARLIYAKACSWKPTDVAQLQEYVDHNRKTHYLDGDYAEYIFPNHELYSRESTLYADIGAYEDDKPFWSQPKGLSLPTLRLDPPSYRAIAALDALGAFSSKGLRIIADIWGQKNFKDSESFSDAERLTEEMLRALVDKNLPHDRATKDDVAMLYGAWQLPMYNIDLSQVEVSMEELQRERDASYPGDY